MSALANDKAYLDDELTLSDLADALDMKPADLTDLIKASPYENFYDLINSHRIETVKSALIKSDEQVIQLTINVASDRSPLSIKFSRERRV